MGSNLEAAARLAARGDAAAFAALCRALQDDIWRYCYALTDDRELAFEAAQETFVRAVGAIRRFRGDAPVRVWLLVLARRATAEVLRGAQHHDRLAVLVEEPSDPAGGAAAGRVELEQLVGALPADLRQAFVLTQLLGLSYEHAGRVAGCPTGTIRSRVYRARARLVAALQSDDGQEDERHAGDS